MEFEIEEGNVASLHLSAIIILTMIRHGIICV